MSVGSYRADHLFEVFDLIIPYQRQIFRNVCPRAGGPLCTCSTCSTVITHAVTEASSSLSQWYLFAAIIDLRLMRHILIEQNYFGKSILAVLRTTFEARGLVYSVFHSKKPQLSFRKYFENRPGLHHNTSHSNRVVP